MDSDRFRALCCKIAGDQSAEIFCPTGDDNSFALDAVIGHEVVSLANVRPHQRPLSSGKDIVYNFGIKIIILTSLVRKAVQ